MAGILVLAAQAGQAAQAAQVAEAPRVTREERFGSWGCSCAVAGNGEGRDVERCMISQMVAVDPQQRKVVLGLNVDLGQGGVPVLRARFASNASRQAGIGIKIDARPPLRLPIDNCDQRRCEAVGRMAQPVLKAWLGGKRAQFAFLQEGGKQVVLPFSLNGFEQALAALRRHPGGTIGPVLPSPAKA